MKYSLVVLDDKGNKLESFDSDSPFGEIHTGDKMAVGSNNKPVWPVKRVDHIVEAARHTVRVHCDLSPSGYAAANE